MLKRKLNAVASLLTTVLLLAHAILLSVYMLSGGRSFRPAGFMGWVLMGVMICHALVSIDLALSAHVEENTRKGKQYPKLNIPTILQRITGLLMVPAAALHIAGATGAMVPPKMVHAIVPPLLRVSWACSWGDSPLPMAALIPPAAITDWALSEG